MKPARSACLFVSCLLFAALAAVLCVGCDGTPLPSDAGTDGPSRSDARADGGTDGPPRDGGADGPLDGIHEIIDAPIETLAVPPNNNDRVARR